MRTEKVIWGLILVFLGTILLLHNLGIIDFHWQVVFRFWPVVLILIGANLVFSRDNSSAGALISILLTVLALVFFAYQGITSRERKLAWTFSDSDHGDWQSSGESQVFTEDYNDSTARAILNISGGATEYTLKDTTAHLFYADVKRSFAKYSLIRTSEGSATVLNFAMRGKADLDDAGTRDNRTIIKLNRNPTWDINLKMGAGEAVFDLSSYKVNNLTFEGGAASFNVKLGEPVAITNVSVKTGASEIVVSLPRTVACKISTKSGLSSNDFEGFKEQADGSYVTENFEQTKKKILLNLKGGLSDFKVERY